MTLDPHLSTQWQIRGQKLYILLNKFKSWSRLLKKVRKSKHTFCQHLEILLSFTVYVCFWLFSGCFKLVLLMIFFFFSLKIRLDSGVANPLTQDLISKNTTNCIICLTNKSALVWSYIFPLILLFNSAKWL